MRLRPNLNPLPAPQTDRPPPVPVRPAPQFGRPRFGQPLPPGADACPTAVALAEGTLIPLDMLRTGECGTVCEVAGDPPAVHRLAELGLGVGAVVKVLREGPPSLLALGAQRFCFRPDAGTQVLVALAAA